ncbi:putative 60s ribosome subunit biogenesis protein nop53 [Phaeomoniella chlamydospora]|uniref:Ribosome biogenesis protein NOP53 n=1 Tax=Phaeomoniella chlamydospora TaxID=158046 RepID=A0A0G2E1H3_PHACM|nr:putative 60s ribosome subunit biogenesis protein nop53 [Phaeomoniella chlamydospora]
MSRTAAAPQQYKQPSRKGKKAWRKNVDISEVQQGLENLREEIIQGGPISEKPSEELFAVDTIGSEAIQRAYNKVHKPLKADEILAQRSVVPGVDTRKRSTSSRITDGVIEPSSKRHKSNWVSKKEVQRLKQIAARNGNGTLSSENLEEDGTSSKFDLWAAPAEAPVTTSSEYIPKPRTKVAPASLRQKPISMVAEGKSVPAVANPKAGTSYNPSFEDWDDLLSTEGRKAVEAEKQRLEDERKAAELQARLNEAAKDPEDGSFDNDESEWEGFETENEKPLHLTKKRPERKTPSQRNKAKRRKEAERLTLHEKRMARKKAQALSSNSKPSSDKSLATTRSPSPDDTISSVDDTRLRRRTLGKAPIPDKPLEVLLPDELQDSLRRLRPEGNLLNDRFRNLLVQGKLETRKPVTSAKKRKVKVTEKWWSKDFKVGA